MNTALEQLAEFFVHYKPIRCKKGETILRDGDIPQGVFYLENGYTRLYSLSSDGEELTLIIFKPGDFFPITWALFGEPYKYYVETMTPSTFYCAPRDHFLQFMEENPSAHFEVTKNVLLKTTGLMSRMEYLAFGNARNKVASILLIFAELMENQNTEWLVFPFPITHKQIASLVGISRETASIEMKQLEKEELISYHGRELVIKNWDGLKEQSLVSHS